MADVDILGDIERERAEATRARSNLKNTLQSQSAVIMDNEKQRANLAVQNAKQQSAAISTIQSDLRELDRLEANPLDAIVAEFKGLFDGQSGKANVTKRVMRTQRDVKLYDADIKAKQAALAAKQTLAQQEIKTASAVASLESEDVTSIRQALQDRITVRQEERSRKSELLQTSDERTLLASRDAGELSAYEVDQELQRRTNYELQSEQLRMSVEQGKVAVAEKVKERALQYAPDSLLNSMLSEAKGAGDGLATDPNSGAVYTTAQIEQVRQTRKAAIAGDAALQAKLLNLEVDTDASVIGAARVLGVSYDPTDPAASMKTIQLDPNVPDKVKKDAAAIEALYGAAGTKENELERMAFLEEANTRAAKLHEEIYKRETELFNSNQERGGKEFLDYGVMRDPASSVGFLAETLALGKSSGSRPYDAYLSVVRDSMSDIQLDEEALKRLADTKTFYPSQYAVLGSLQTAEPGSKPDRVRTQATAAMMQTANFEVIDRAVTELSDNAELSSAWMDSGGNIVNFMRAIKDPAVLQAFKEKLNEVLPAYVKETFDPVGPGRYTKAAQNNYAFGNDVSNYFKTQFSTNMQGWESAARMPEGQQAAQTQLTFEQQLGASPLLGLMRNFMGDR